jgi:hypothetical protein
MKELSGRYYVEERIENVLDLEKIEASLALRLPADYKYFLMWQGAGSTLPPLHYRRIYPLSELLERNESGQPPETLEFATDDSLGFAFDLSRQKRMASYPVINYPLGETSRSDTECEANDFAGFIARCLELQDDEEDSA